MNTALDYSEELELLSDVPWWVGDILRDETSDRTFWITKGLGSGGTYGTAIWHLIMCHMNWESPFSWSIAPTFTQVFDTLIPTFVDVASRYFGWEDGRDYRIIRSLRPRMVLIGTGQEIHFKSADRPEAFVGPSISHVSATELGLWRKRTGYEKSCARLRCPKAVRRQYVGEGSPEGDDHWWADDANFPEGVDEERNCVRIVLWTDDNPHLPAEYIQNQLVKVYGKDPARLESYRYGTFTKFTKGSAYWEWFERRNMVEVKASPFLAIVLGFDFNVTVAWSAWQYQVHTRSHVRRSRWAGVAESSGESRGLDRAIAEFAFQFPVEEFAGTEIEIDGDCSGYADSHKTDLSDYAVIEKGLGELGYRNVRVTARRSNPEIKDRLQRIAWLMSNELLVVSPRCKNLIGSFGKTKLVKGTWKIDKPQEDTWSHWADSAGYPLYWRSKHIDFKGIERKIIRGVNA